MSVWTFFLKYLLDEECECNPYNISQPGFSDLCSGDMFYQTKFCYVTPDSRCGDKRTSRLYPSLYWSTEACGYPSASSSSTLSLSSSLFHQSWNFSSSYEECAGYCGSRERCEEGNIHVRFDTVNNICMMDFVPVGHLHLDHINPWLWLWRTDIYDVVIQQDNKQSHKSNFLCSM